MQASPHVGEWWHNVALAPHSNNEALFVHYPMLYLKPSKQQIKVINYIYFFRIFLTHNSLWKTRLKCPHMVLYKIWCKMSNTQPSNLSCSTIYSQLTINVAQLMIWLFIFKWNVILFIYFIVLVSIYIYWVCNNVTFFLVVLTNLVV